jgi:hypothetical protein
MPKNAKTKNRNGTQKMPKTRNHDKYFFWKTLTRSVSQYSYSTLLFCYSIFAQHFLVSRKIAREKMATTSADASIDATAEQAPSVATTAQASYLIGL